MKVAVSIPDPIFAEALPWRSGSEPREASSTGARSGIVSRHAADPVTRTMNEVVDAVGDTDEFGAEASRRVLKRVEL